MRTGLTMIKELDGIKFYGEIATADILRLKLDRIDQALMNDVGINAPIADNLLVMEMLFRRMQEQFPEAIRGEGK